MTHVLISRPQPQCDELAGALLHHGFEVISLPAFRFEPITAEDNPLLSPAPESSPLLVFTSPRAVQFGLNRVPDEVLQQARFASVGPATTQSLEMALAALPVPITASVIQAPGPVYNSEALLSVLHSVQPRAQAVIVTAPGGRELIEEQLQQSGWEVCVFPVYRRVACKIDASMLLALDTSTRLMSIWTSATALEHLFEQLPDAGLTVVKRGVMVVNSERLANLARFLGGRNVLVADGPDNDSLVTSALQAGGS